MVTLIIASLNQLHFQAFFKSITNGTRILAMYKIQALQTFRLLIWCALVHLAFQNCFKLKLQSAKSKDSEFYRCQVRLNSNNTVDTSARLTRPVKVPLWHFKLLQTGEKYNRVHYDVEIKACDLANFMKRVRFFREMFASFFTSKKGNLTLKCPMAEGFYVMNNLFVPPESSFIRYLFVPNTVITLRGGVKSQMPNMQVDNLCWYEFNATISRNC